MTTTGQHILIVEDDVDIREMLAEALETRGFAVATAANGLEALALLRSPATNPLLIVLDLTMPVMDGYQFIEEQRKDPSIASIPVVLVTASVVDRSRLGECPQVLPKPLKLPKLLEILETLPWVRPAA